jgi:(p)ppGpp synthase/HD superfamily hydrolase
MIHTARIRKALQFAARRHNGQLRREADPLPYITHPVSVALLLADEGAEENTIIAALLHDTVEDTETTAEQLLTEFGPEVTELVLAVSEPKTDTAGTVLTWKQRKDTYLAQLSKASDQAVLVSMADKIDNIESKAEALRNEGTALHQHWAQSPDVYVWFHGAVLEEARKRGITGALRDRFESVHAAETTDALAK